MFDVGPFEILVILVASLFIFGPDRLPKAAAQAAKIIRELRGMASGARADLGDALGPDLADLTMNLRDLDPRAAITRALMDDDTGPAGSKPAGIGSTPTGPRRSGPVTGSQPAVEADQTPRFDADAT